MPHIVSCKHLRLLATSTPVRCAAVWLPVVGLLLSYLCSAGCRQDSPSGSGVGTRRIILLTNGDDPFWDAMRQGMNQASIDLKLAEANLAAFLDKGDFSEEAQINKLTQYATQSDVAAVAIASVDARNRGIAEAMKALRANGVHVIAVDSDMDDKSTRFAYLGSNNIFGGQQLGRAAAGLRPEGGKYATFVGLKTMANAIERISGFGQGAGPKFQELDSLADQGDENLAQENVKAALNNHPELDTLVGIWAYNAHAIVKVVLDRKLRERTTIVVYDAAPAALADMEQGYIDAMIVQNPYQMGYLGTQLMKALIEDDQQTIARMYPGYDPQTGKFNGPEADVFTTEMRIVVPDANSPLRPDMFSPETRFFKISEFRQWLRERNLTGS